MKKILAIGNDHAGTELKNKIIEKFKDEVDFIDCGTNTKDSVDYADYSRKVCSLILNKKVESGILICGTGLGISISANRNKGIRAALCFHSQMARLARQHNDANIICFGARMLGEDVIFESIQTFLKTDFEGGRHLKRIEKIETEKIN